MAIEDSVPAEPGTGADVPGVRQVSDAQTLRALTHPVRIALIEALSLGGAMTATQVGEQIGESPTTCSFHLRQLAKYGFVEEAGGGRGRARPWRMTTIGMSLVADGADAESEIAAAALLRIVRERQLNRYQTWLETKSTYPPHWRAASSESQFVFYLTADELDQLNTELIAMLQPRMRERLTDPSQRPPGAAPVELLMFSYPMALPPDGADQQAARRRGPKDS